MAAAREAAVEARRQCLAPEPDSAAAAAAAISALEAAGGELRLNVSSFMRHHDGYLISVLPANEITVGGGGLVWVDHDGCVMVIRSNE